MKNLVSRAMRCAAVAVGVVFGFGSAVAEGVWTKGIKAWTNDNVPAAVNLLKGVEPVDSLNFNLSQSSCATTLAVLTDGVKEQTLSKCACIKSNAAITYILPYPCRIDEIRVYNPTWAARNTSAINSIAVSPTDYGEEWITVGGAVSYSAGSACLTSGTASVPLVERAQRITINWGSQQNSYVACAEIEVLGEGLDYAVVRTEPFNIVDTTPQTGLRVLGKGVEQTFSAPAGPITDETGYREYAFEGYEIAYQDGTVKSGSDDSITLTPEQAFVLTWKYTLRDRSDVGSIDAWLVGKYVSKGLIAFYDANFNQGTDQPHSLTATTWKDLSGNGFDLGQLTGSDGTVVALPTWGDHYAQWTGLEAGEMFMRKNPTGAGYLDRNTNFTFEVCAEITENAGNNKGIYFFPATDNTWGYSNQGFDARFASGGLYYAPVASQWKLTWPGSQTSGPGTYSWSAVVNEAGTPVLYYRGEYKTTASGTVETKNRRAMRDFYIGGSTYTASNSGSFGGGMKAKVYTVKLYDWQIGEKGVRHNYAIDAARYLGGQLGDTVICVTHSPAAYGYPDPAYGYRQATAGSDLRLTVEDRLSTYADGVRACRVANLSRAAYLGYSVAIDDAEVECGTAERATYRVRETGPCATTLTWKWRLDHRVTISTDTVGATVGIDDGETSASLVQWLSDGTNVTVRAVAPKGMAFQQWAGDTDGLADATAAETVLTVESPKTLTPVFIEKRTEKITARVKPTAGGSWFDPANWVDGMMPQDGDDVELAGEDGDSPVLTVDATPPHVARLSVSNESTLVCKNWTTCLVADEVIVGAGGVIRPERGFYEFEMSNRVWIAASRLVVEPGGRIDANAAGWAPGNGTCWQLATSRNGTVGAAHGGRAAENYSEVSGYSASSAQTYGDAQWPYAPGCGYGTAAYETSLLSDAGGGAIFLEMPNGELKIDGVVTACAPSLEGKGGGSGGSVLIVCRTIDGSGSVLATGSDASTNYRGGGGRIAVHYDAVAQAEKDASCRVAFRAMGGRRSGSSQLLGEQGGPGSLWFTDNRFLTSSGYDGHWKFSGVWHSDAGLEALDVASLDVVIDDDQLEFDGLSSAVLKSITATATVARTRGLIFDDCSSVEVRENVVLNGASLRMKGETLSVGGDMTLVGAASRYAAGELWLQAVAATEPDGFGIRCEIGGALLVGEYGYICERCQSIDGSIPGIFCKNFKMAENGIVTADGFGYAARQGPGWKGGAAGSHGGRGAGSIDVTNLIYGDKERPREPGCGTDAAGGGVVYIEAEDRILVNGTISANGGTGGTAPGAGGSIWLIGRRVDVRGILRAKGANGQFPGGGGRIAIYSSRPCPDESHIDVSCGSTTLTTPPAFAATDGTFFYKRLPGHGMILMVK